MHMPTHQTFQYQEDGARWLSQRERAGLHDEMGVGKTATAWRAADMLDARRGLVICPAHLRENWIKEHAKFAHKARRLCKGEDHYDFEAWYRGRFDVLITSYEQATKWAPKIHDSGEILDFVIFDEAHYMKNTEARRTKALLGPRWDGQDSAITWALRVWHLTGTPMANDPSDIYTFLRMCEATNLGKYQFISRYFHAQQTRYGSRHTPIRMMIPELQGLIRDNAIRRTQEEVGLQLPPIHLTSSFVDGDTDEVLKLLKAHPGLEDAIRIAVEQGGLSNLAAKYMATLRRLVGEAKQVPYGYMLLDELTTGGDTGKRVVYGVHRAALGNLKQFLLDRGIGAVLVNGDTPQKERDIAVTRFQENPECRVFIGNMKAAGTGLTLTASCRIDIFESEWSPAANVQAIKRVHRIGQKDHVHARFITLANSIDEMVNEVVARKTIAIAKIDGVTMNAAPLDLAIDMR